MTVVERWDRINDKNRLEIVEHKLEDYEKRIFVKSGLTVNEIIEYNKLVSEHKELIDRLGYATLKYKKEEKSVLK